MSETHTTKASKGTPRTDEKAELVLAEPLAESSIVNTTPVHIPGMPLETVADRENRLAVEAEKADHVDTRSEVVADPREVLATDTRTPRANLATRSNIVPAGPGSAGDEPALDLPGLTAEAQAVDPSRDGVQVIELRDAE